MAQFNTSCSSLPDASYKPAVRQNTHAVSSVQAKIAAFKGNLKTQTQELDVPSSPKVNQHNKLSLAQQSLSHRNGVVDIICTKPPKLPKTQKPNYIRTCGTQNNLQRESTVPVKRLPSVLALGSPPPKPPRPPIDIHRFGINLKYANDGLGMKIPRPVAPPPLPARLHPCPSSDHAAILNQQLDEDESYEDVGIMNPSPLTLAEHPLKRTEAHMREDLYKELNHGWMEQTKNSGREDANHGQVTEERQEKPKGTIVSEEMKGQDIKSKTEKKKKSGHEANKKFKIKGPVHLTTKRKELVNFKGGKADLSLNQGEIIEDIHKTDDYVKNESVNTGHDDLKEEEEETGTRIYQSEAESDIYDDIGEPAEVCRVFLLPQPNTDGDDVYDDVNYEDIDYVDVKEDCIYEID